MTLVQYPTQANLPGLGFGIKWTVEFFNMPSAVAVSGASIDLAYAATPLHTFELTYNFLRDQYGAAPLIPSVGQSEFKALMGFFMAVGGSAGRFTFLNPDDYTMTLQPLGTTDGVTSIWQIVRTLGTGAYAGSDGTEPVGVVDTTQPVSVYLNGALVSSSVYAIVTTSPCNQLVQFIAPPTSGQSVEISCSYLYYCRFLENSLSFEKMYNDVWNATKVVIQSCRAGA